MTTATTIPPFRKTVRPGLTIHGSLYVDIEWTGTRLSLMGVVGPRTDGDCTGDCGQCISALEDIREYAPGWESSCVERLAAIWDRWHLNDMRAGCEHQRAAKWGTERCGEQCPECQYRYGTEWLHEDVPERVLHFLRGVPEADRPHPWPHRTR